MANLNEREHSPNILKNKYKYRLKSDMSTRTKRRRHVDGDGGRTGSSLASLQEMRLGRTDGELMARRGTTGPLVSSVSKSFFPGECGAAPRSC